MTNLLKMSSVLSIILLMMGCYSQPQGTAENRVQEDQTIGFTQKMPRQSSEENVPETIIQEEILEPEQMVLLAFKESKTLELWYVNGEKFWFVQAYPILGASGRTGPKLKQGDQQVPEGVYKITTLNPYSQYHLSMMLDYPNEFDQEMARQEGRSRLGGWITIHGGTYSRGCLAIGDEAIEALYQQVTDIGKENVTVIIAPYDFRITPYRPDESKGWVDELYQEIAAEVQKYGK